jgi:hypothetical protein
MFNGIIRNWSKNISTNGTIYDVQIVDPRVFFDGINIIINEYTYQVSTANLINAYGYLENVIGFGSSKANEAGVPVNKIISAITTLSSVGTTVGSYSGGINFHGFNYFIDLSNVPTVSDDLRISGVSITLSDLINEIAEYTSSSWMSELINVNGFWVIRFKFVDRSALPVFGTIGNFTQSIPEAIVKQNGVELVDEVSTKFLYGGKKTDMYLQTYKDGYIDGRSPEQLNVDRVSDSSKLNPIWMYFGVDLNSNLVLTYSNFTKFTIDARNVILDGVGSTYETDELEIRAAQSSIETWRSFLIMMWPFEYYPDENGTDIDYPYITVAIQNANKNKNKNKSVKKASVPTPITYQLRQGDATNSKPYKHSRIRNPHFKKIFKLK